MATCEINKKIKIISTRYVVRVGGRDTTRGILDALRQVPEEATLIDTVIDEQGMVELWFEVVEHEI